tara:strand:+ start:201 stop:773 length:573 start_codon:yes stop_codon:yes gene_type:complete
MLPNAPNTYHVTHISNLQRIADLGLISYTHIQEQRIEYKDISNKSVKQRRSKIEPIYKRKLHDYVPTYFNPKNPFQYAQEVKEWDQLAILEVSKEIFSSHEFIFTDGNAASGNTRFFNDISLLTELPWETLNSRYWADKIDGRRQMCAECLFYPKIERNFIVKLHFRSIRFDSEFSKFGFEIVHSPKLFF